MKVLGRREGLWVVFFASGAPGLVAQVAWTRVFGASLGHEYMALAGVVSAYFAGMAIGAAAIGKCRERHGSDDGGRTGEPGTRGFAKGWFRSTPPERIYAVLEWSCAAWILVTTPWLREALAWVQSWRGPGSSVAGDFVSGFLVPLLVIGPAAAALGATLPALERAVAPLESDRRAVAALYAWNTAGAVFGIVAAIEFLTPTFGFRASLYAAAGVQLVCGAAAWAMGRSLRHGVGKWGTPGTGANPGHGPGGPDDRVVTAGGRRDGRVGWRWRGPRSAIRGMLGPDERWDGRARRRRWVFFAMGLLGVGYEFLGVRALAQTTENTVRTFGVAVAAMLVGTAAGAAVCRSWQGRRGSVGGAGVFVLLALACLGSVWVLVGAAGSWGPIANLMGGFATEASQALLIFAIPAAGMGWAFSSWVQSEAEGARGIGGAIAWNLAGSAAAGPVFVGALLPLSGLKAAMVFVVLGYLALGGPWWWRGCRRVLPIGVVAALVLLPAGLRLLELPPRAEVLREWDGRLASVAVIRTGDGERVLRVNNHFQQGGTATASAARRHAHIPLLLHPAPGRALFLGVGTGITMGAAADHAGLSVDGVELLPEVVKALSSFEPENRSPSRREGMTIHVSDARRWIRTVATQYDVIVADLFHPAEDGAGMLYTREHFRAMRDRLSSDGLVCQWLPLHQLDLESFREISATFLDVFPESSAWLLRFNADVPVVGLIGTLKPLEVNPVALARRMAEPALAEALRPLALADPIRLMGCHLAGAESLRSWCRGARPATDDLPGVMFRAARSVYSKLEAPHERLAMVLERLEPGFSGILGSEAGREWVVRLEAFRRGRDLHLLGLGKEYSGRLREAVEDYLASAAIPGEYTAGYAQAVLVASAHAREDPTWARSLVERLIQARPEQGLARELLSRLP